MGNRTQTRQTRQPRGVPVGGQFAAKSNPEADVDLGPGLDAPLLCPIGYEEREELDELIPQANSPEKIFAVVDAVAGDCVRPDEIGGAIGVSKRQGSYYAEAARALGVVDRSESPISYQLTERGAEVYRMSDQDRAAAMSQAIAENAQVNTYLMDGEDALAASWEQDLSEVTIQRRLSTIKSWSTYFLSEDSDQRAMMATSRSETCERAPIIVAARPKPPQTRRCPRCNLELPTGSDLCNICD